MKQYFARLSPAERRFVVGVGLVLFLVFNWMFVWPHFSDWRTTQSRLDTARMTLGNRTVIIQQADRLKPELARMEGEGAAVPPEDQATEFLRTIQSQAQQSGVMLMGSSRSTTRTNDPFFLEQVQTINVQSTEKQLVDFLYNLGAGGSLIRVRSLSVRPDQTRQQLTASITLVASYQKNPKAAAPATAAAKPATPAPAAPASAPAPTAGALVRPQPAPQPSTPTPFPPRPVVPQPRQPNLPKPATPTHP
ncbi:MAG: hypothetical protein U1F98_09150 [Verrucomicrobiota bacterium]